MRATLRNLCTSTALALTPASGLAMGLGADGEWSDLDREVNALASSLLLKGGGPGLFGRVQTAYRGSSDLPGGLGGFGVADARLGLTGAHGSYEYRLEVDFADDLGSGTLGLLDAHASFALTDTVTATLGRFRPEISTNGLLDSGDMVFLGRSVIGTALAARDEGLMLQGALSDLDWTLCIMNGLDGQDDDALASLRINLDLKPSPQSPIRGRSEGAYGGPEEFGVRASVAFVEDRDPLGSYCALAELLAGSDRWSLAFETAHVGSRDFASLTSNISDILAADTNPYSLGLTLMVQEDWELALRVQDYDLGDLRQFDLGLNHYVAGHDLKWILGLTHLESDTAAKDVDLWGFALNVGF